MDSPYTISNNDLMIIYDSEEVNDTAAFYKLRPVNEQGFSYAFGNNISFFVDRDMEFLESVMIQLPGNYTGFPSGGLSYTVDIWVSSDVVSIYHYKNLPIQ